MHWTQIYDPFGRWWLSTLVATLPVLVLFGLLVGLKFKPHWCAVWGATTAAFVAVEFFKMPLILAATSFAYGVGFGLLKIAWIVLTAVFSTTSPSKPGNSKSLKSRWRELLPTAGCKFCWWPSASVRSSKAQLDSAHPWPSPGL